MVIKSRLAISSPDEFLDVVIINQSTLLLTTAVVDLVSVTVVGVAQCPRVAQRLRQCH